MSKMSRRSSRKFTAAFKAQVALEAVKENQTMAELAMRFDLSTLQIGIWKKQLAENASGVFEGAATTTTSTWGGASILDLLHECKTMNQDTSGR